MLNLAEFDARAHRLQRLMKPNQSLEEFSRMVLIILGEYFTKQKGQDNLFIYNLRLSQQSGSWGVGDPVLHKHWVIILIVNFYLMALPTLNKYVCAWYYN